MAADDAHRRLMNMRKREGKGLVLPILIFALIGTVSWIPSPTPSPSHSDGSVDAAKSWVLTALIGSSTDLGPAHDPLVSTVFSLRDSVRPVTLFGWAARHGLRVQWQTGMRWAGVMGSAAQMGSALEVSIHDYRSRRGQTFYATEQQIAVPADLSSTVRQIGRILNYRMPETADLLTGRPMDVPANGLTPSELLNAYGASGLAAQGFTGRNSTIVFYEWSPPNQAELDQFSKTVGLPQFTPVLVGGSSGPSGAVVETMMDLEVAHAIAPDARLVVVNAGSTLSGTYGDVGLSLASLFQSVDRQFPGAVWSLSIGWGCDQLFTAPDMAPVESALEQAEAHGTSVFDATGDTGGLECKGNSDYSTPPNQSDVGVDAVASLPGMTAVGGTLLSTDASGNWASEQAWDDSAMSQGGSGGVSTYLPRPSWQIAQGIATARDQVHRLIPDVSADADPSSGVAYISGGQWQQGGGTSQAAPIWAGLTTLMDEYLLAHGGHLAGALNPLLYHIANGAARPAFHDVVLGGNAVDLAGPGYDLVTGLGTPIAANLATDLLDVQTGRG